MVRYNRSFMLRRKYNKRTYKPKRRVYKGIKRIKFNRMRLARKFTNMGKIVSGLPNKLKYTFKSISNNLAINPAATFVTYSFNLNSIVDPFGTGGSSRPYLYNQLTALYNRYKVIGGHVKFTFINQTSNPCTVGIVVRSDNEAPTTLQELSIIKGGYYRNLTSFEGSRNTCTLTKNFSIRKWFGTDGFYTDLSALTTAEPVRRLYCFVCIESNDYTSADNIIGVGRIQMYQRTVLYDPEVQDMSVPALEVPLKPVYVRNNIANKPKSDTQGIERTGDGRSQERNSVILAPNLYNIDAISEMMDDIVE